MPDILTEKVFCSDVTNRQMYCLKAAAPKVGQTANVYIYIYIDIYISTDGMPLFQSKNVARLVYFSIQNKTLADP